MSLIMNPAPPSLVPLSTVALVLGMEPTAPPPDFGSVSEIAVIDEFGDAKRIPASITPGHGERPHILVEADDAEIAENTFSILNDSSSRNIIAEKLRGVAEGLV